MAIGSGIGAQLGITSETTFNTAVTVDHFLEFNSENLALVKKVSVGSGLRAGGKLPRINRRVITTSEVKGDIVLDVPSRGMGLLLSKAMGTAPSPVTVTTGVYSYTFTLGDLYGKSMTVQVGVPQYGGTVTPKTITGAKVMSWELSVASAGLLVGKFTLDGAAMTTGVSLAVASFSNFATTNLFNFSQGSITIDGTTAANIRDFTLTVDNAIKADRYVLNATGIKSEQIIQGFRKISGKMSAEFSDTVLLTHFLADSSAAIVLTFTGAVIANGAKELLTITIPAVKFNTDTPNVAGPGVIDLAMDFDGYDDGTDEPLTILYQTADAAL